MYYKQGMGAHLYDIVVYQAGDGGGCGCSPLSHCCLSGWRWGSVWVLTSITLLSIRLDMGECVGAHLYHIVVYQAGDGGVCGCSPLWHCCLSGWRWGSVWPVSSLDHWLLVTQIYRIAHAPPARRYYKQQQHHHHRQMLTRSRNNLETTDTMAWSSLPRSQVLKIQVLHKRVFRINGDHFTVRMWHVTNWALQLINFYVRYYQVLKRP